MLRGLLRHVTMASRSRWDATLAQMVSTTRFCLVILSGRDKSQMALHDPQPGVIGNSAEHGYAAVALHCVSQLLLMAASGYVIQDHRRHVRPRLEVLISAHEGGNAARHPFRIDDKDDRRLKHPCKPRNAPFAVVCRANRRVPWRLRRGQCRHPARLLAKEAESISSGIRKLSRL